MSLSGKTILITGASRGIGRAIALRLANERCNIVIVAKSVTEDPKLGGTIHSVAAEIEALGGKALPVQCDIRFEDAVNAAVRAAVETFGGIDVVVNNASAISLTSTAKTEMKRYDLMQNINVRGAFMMVRACLPYLSKSAHAHILTLSPPLDIRREWLSPHVAYSISKFNMTMLTVGWAGEFSQLHIAANTLWPKTTIATAAVRNLLGGEALVQMSRKPEIVADAACFILQRSPAECTGNMFTDEQVLESEGITDLGKYSVVPGGRLYPDLFT